MSELKTQLGTLLIQSEAAGTLEQFVQDHGVTREVVDEADSILHGFRERLDQLFTELQEFKSKHGLEDEVEATVADDFKVE